ncbi:MAG: orotidine-5'-phosphate decarboxylase [Flavobacteriales bacterium]|nr:orotidine-5'-phosphate decarboxylase [Flavobacteriales bacterium]|tara:strand:+ start:15567 stop:16385 length:819 start_codon:yes stop_codon:yes gene_type:complete
MNRHQLIEQIKEKKSFLCVGLDTDLSRIPVHLLGLEDPVFEFNKQIIDATKDLCVAYKPNIAFYESLGVSGLISLQKTLDYIPENIFTIADAKRGDVGNTSKMYAKAFFENMNFHSITVSPYMGKDSVTPFLSYKNKWVILLALTSNEGGKDFQFLKTNNKSLYKYVIETSSKWASPANMMYVVGATQAESLLKIRKTIPEHFLLVPGVGAQGGSLAEVSKFGMNKDCGLLVNSSRAIIYASEDRDFAEIARKRAFDLQNEMYIELMKANIV